MGRGKRKATDNTASTETKKKTRFKGTSAQRSESVIPSPSTTAFKQINTNPSEGRVGKVGDVLHRPNV